MKLQVSAVNEIGESILSPANSVVFANVPTAPASLSLKASAYPASIVASWTAPLNSYGNAVTGYDVYVDDGHGGPYTIVFNGTNTASTYSFTINSLTCGLFYTVKVSAENSAGIGPFVY